jgi:8-oxo-dGTP pyrophosphatase MutT (NUDIX family)
MRSYGDRGEMTSIIRVENEIDGYWAGQSGFASGILPFCTITRRFCLAERSGLVHQGRCWSTFGGACPRGTLPRANAIREFREETCYQGSIATLYVYRFTDGRFRYITYVGMVDREFDLPENPATCWETSKLKWFTLSSIEKAIVAKPVLFHPGFIVMLKRSRAMLSRLVDQ